MLNFNVNSSLTQRAQILDTKVMLCEGCVNVKLDLTLLQLLTNVVITLCASWEWIIGFKIRESVIMVTQTGSL